MNQISAGTVVLNGYTLLELMEQGALCSTWTAASRETNSSRIVQARIAFDGQDHRLFKREVDFLRHLDHHGVVKILEFGTDVELELPISISPSEEDQTRALTHFFQGGSNTAQYPVEPIQIIRRLAETLIYLHAAGIVHCDLSSDSVLVTPSGDARIRDFFFAGRPGEVAVHSAKDGVSQLWVRTLRYSPPEIMVDELVTESMDKFSFAVISYRILTGHPPFRESPPNAIRNGHSVRNSPALSRRQYRAFARALNEDPNQRTESLESFVDAITPRKKFWRNRIGS